MPAGGVPVGYTFANKLGIPMDVIIVRKVQIPWNTEAGFGALTWDGETDFNETLIRHLGLTKDVIDKSVAETRRVIKERLRKFRRDKHMPDLNDKVVILVDDGLTSGFAMLAAARSAKKVKLLKVVVLCRWTPLALSCYLYTKWMRWYAST